MSPLSWTLRQLLIFWLGALGVATFLRTIDRHRHPGPGQFFWLLPARNLAHGLWLATRAIFRVRPLEVFAILAVPLATLLVTGVWAVGRILQR